RGTAARGHDRGPAAGAFGRRRRRHPRRGAFAVTPGGGRGLTAPSPGLPDPPPLALPAPRHSRCPPHGTGAARPAATAHSKEGPRPRRGPSACCPLPVAVLCLLCPRCPVGTGPGQGGAPSRPLAPQGLGRGAG